MSINIVSFDDLETVDFFVDTVYKGGLEKNLGGETLSKLMHVGNTGGFRKCKKTVNVICSLYERQ